MLFFLGGPHSLYRGEDMELYYLRYAAAQPEEMGETAREIVHRSGEAGPSTKPDQVWVSMKTVGNEGSLYVRTEDGGWYSASFVSFGKKPFLIEETAWRLPEPPGLTDALQIL